MLESARATPDAAANAELASADFSWTVFASLLQADTASKTRSTKWRPRRMSSRESCTHAGLKGVSMLRSFHGARFRLVRSLRRLTFRRQAQKWSHARQYSSGDAFRQWHRRIGEAIFRP